MDDEIKTGQVEETPEPEKERSGFVTTMLWLTIVGTLLTSFRYIVGMFVAFSQTVSLGNGLLSILCVIHILGLCLLMRWQKVGFYLMSITYLLAIAVGVCCLNLDAAYWALPLFAILAWWAILQIRKNGVSTWKQLTGGWDFRNSKDAYIFSLSVLLVSIIITAIAVHRSSQRERQLEPYMEDLFGSNSSSGSSDSSYKAKEENSVNEQRNGQIDQGKTKTQKAEAFLISALEEANEDYPEEIATGITMTEIRIEGDYVVYVAECDEDLIDVDLLNIYKDEMTESMREDATSSDPEVAYFIRMCTNANKGIAYKYIGDKSGKTCIIRFSCSELLEMK